MAFKKLFPWDYGTAFLACLIVNMTRGKDDKAKTVGDFMPADIDPVDPLENTFANFRHLAAMSNEDNG